MNPFRECRCSFKFGTLAHLAPMEGPCDCGKTEKKNDQLPPQIGAKNNIKPRLPSDSKMSLPNITSCYSNRRQLDNLVTSWILGADRQDIDTIDYLK
ncbi:hypothetical protein AVEN_3809-1 [Araneus ventricosus]|uniref:Uncharacterized protein n=1 Tax=Araneus ventricosus TaxID=182803 RepID=A0A4Y2HE33_ARAVE|nr:hypothetical protein AVEN_3809-1 [Araneus ventricosus]